MRRWDWEHPDFSSLAGRTLVGVERRSGEEGDELWLFDSEYAYVMYHERDCCESVQIEDVVGDHADVIGAPLLIAEESASQKESNEFGTSTWTYYRLATIKGDLSIRWLGESNGYYSESVSFARQPLVRE